MSLLAFEDLGVGFGAAGNFDSDVEGLAVGREFEAASTEESSADFVGDFDGAGSGAGEDSHCRR